MTEFTDKDGRAWTLRLTVGSLAAFRAAGIDLSKALRSAEGLAEILFADPENLVRVLWVLCEGQAKEKGVDPQAFAEGFDGPALESATEALLSAVADFFPRTAVGKALRESQPKTLAAMDRALIQAMTRRAESAISTLNDTVGNSPGTSAATPAP